MNLWQRFGFVLMSWIGVLFGISLKPPRKRREWWVVKLSYHNVPHVERSRKMPQYAAAKWVRGPMYEREANKLATSYAG